MGLFECVLKKPTTCAKIRKEKIIETAHRKHGSHYL